MDFFWILVFHHFANHHPRCRSLQVPSVLEVLRAAVGDEGFRRDPCLLNSGERDLCAPWISAAVLSFWMAKVSTLATPFWMRFHQVEKLTNEASWQLPTCWIRVFKGLLRFMNSFKKSNHNHLFLTKIWSKVEGHGSEDPFHRGDDDPNYGHGSVHLPLWQRPDRLDMQKVVVGKHCKIVKDGEFWSFLCYLALSCRRKFRSQTSDNMERWKSSQQGEESEEKRSEEGRCRCAKR